MSYACKRHGLRQGRDGKEGYCDLCETVCRGCGGPKESIAFLAAMSGAERLVYKDPHKNCDKELNSFWITK